MMRPTQLQQDLPDSIIVDDSHLELSPSDLKRERKEIKYYERIVQLQDQAKNEIIATKEERIFDCVAKEEDQNFYVTYGFLDDYYFIFNRVYSWSTADHSMIDSGVKLFSLAEPTPRVMKFRNQQHVEKVFLNSMANLGLRK